MLALYLVHPTIVVKSNIENKIGPQHSPIKLIAAIDYTLSTKYLYWAHQYVSFKLDTYKKVACLKVKNQRILSYKQHLLFSFKKSKSYSTI